MNVVQVTLIAIAAMVGIILLMVPLIFYGTAVGAKSDIPREVFRKEGPRIGSIPTFYLFLAAASSSLMASACRYFQWQFLRSVFSYGSDVLFIVVIVAYVVWMIRTLRCPPADLRLQSYAKNLVASLAACTGIGLLLFVAFWLRG